MLTTGRCPRRRPDVSMRTRSSRAPVAAGAALTMLAALAAGLTACGSGGGPAGRPADVVTVRGAQCGGSWRVQGPGWHTSEVPRQGQGGAEIDLIDPASGGVYAEVENIGPGTTTPMTVNLGSGTYAFLCLFSDFD